MLTAIDIATTFATALDEDNYNAAGEVIHLDCVYVIRDKTFTGRIAILDSYRTASEIGRATFDTLEYDSIVSMTNDTTAVIEFLDILAHRGRRHVYRCRQVLTIADGLITHIEHCDLPGESDSIAAFKRAVGLDT